MRAAARKHGATLLPERVEVWTEPWQCSSAHEPDPPPCRPWWDGAEGPWSRLRDPDGHWHIVVPIPNDGSADYTWLARRNDRLLFLHPRIVVRHVQERGACDCNGGYTVFFPKYRAFVLDDLPVTGMDQIEVEVVDERIRWHCRVLLVRGEPRSQVW
jgi:hypothetical protein